MKRLFSLYAIGVLIVSVCAFPQDDASQAEAPGGVPNSGSSAEVADELSAEELVGDDVEGQGRGAEEPEKPPYGKPQPEKPEPEKPYKPEKPKPEKPYKPEKPSKPEKPQPERPWLRPGPVCTAYTEAGKNQRQEAIDVCLKKGLDKEECVKKFCSAANGPTLGCNENCTKCPYSNQYNNKEKC